MSMTVFSLALLRRIGRALANVYHSLYLPPALIFAAIIIATIFGWRAASESLRHDVNLSANTRIAAFEQSLTSHLTAYEQIVRGGVGLFQGSDDVKLQDFTNFISAFSASTHYPGVQGIAYAKLIPAEELPLLTNYLASQGIENFQLRPADPPRELYAATIYIQPIAARSANPSLGFDAYSEPTRYAAATKARDTGQTVITGRITFSSKDTTTPPVGFNMYAPYYGPRDPQTLTERRAALRGYVYASFRSAVFFKEIVEKIDGNAMGFQVYAQGDTPNGPLYESSTYKRIQASSDAALRERSFNVHGQVWHIRYALNPQALVSEVQLRRPGGVVFFGVFSAVLITTIIFLLLRSRAKVLQAQKERDVEVVKEELLSLASHQLRTPATGVKQYLGMVLQGFAGRIPKDQRPLLEKAYASNDRQLQAINEILHMAKIDSGKVVLARQETNMNDLLHDIVSEQKPDIENAKHTIRLRLTKPAVWLNVDTHMLRMAIENLLSNAIKYTPQGGRIMVRMYTDETNLHLVISDNGVGIDEADFSKLFKQFTRLPNEMSQRVSGTGVGLYLAKHLVALHHGSISVRSKLGKGATFTITLPLEPNSSKEYI